MPFGYKLGGLQLRTIILIVCGVVLLLLVLRHFKKQPGQSIPAEVPATYAALYAGLDKGLTELNTQLATKPITNTTVTFGAEALLANGNRGADLLKPTALEGVKLELDQLKKLGVQGVTIALPYPLFVPGFEGSADYRAFYQAVVPELRARGLKLDIEMGDIFAQTDFSGLAVDYSHLTFAQYTKERHEMAQVIITELAPDYLNLGSEPDTFAKLTGFTELNNPANYAAHITDTLAGLDRKTTLVGAGAATWSSVEFMTLLARDTSVDFLSTHLYPLTKGTLANLAQAAALAKQYNKRLILDEAWLYKAAPRESASNIAATSTIFKRDLYSFWQPLDQKFLTALVAIARTSNIEYVSPYWSRNFFTYIDYSPQLDKLSYPEVLATYNKQLIKDMTSGTFSATGLVYKRLISQD